MSSQTLHNDLPLDSPEQRAHAALDKATAALDGPNVAAARVDADLAVALWRQCAPDSAECVRAQLVLGQVMTLEAHYIDAAKLLESALLVAERMAYSELICEIHGHLVLICSDCVGLYEVALLHATVAVEVAESAHLPLATVRALIRLAGAVARSDPGERAERLGLLALSLARDQHFDGEVWRALTTLSMVTNCSSDVHEDNPELARVTLERSLEYARRAYRAALQVDVPQALANTLLNQAEPLMKLGRHDEADALREQALGLTAQTGLVRYELAALREKADSLVRHGRLDEAYQILAALHRHPDVQQHPRVRHLLARSAYRCCKQLGRFEEALAHLEEFYHLDMMRVTDVAKAKAQFIFAEEHLAHARTVVARVGDSLNALERSAQARHWLDSEH